jgi:hypothetical protein
MKPNGRSLPVAEGQLFYVDDCYRCIAVISKPELMRFCPA